MKHIGTRLIPGYASWVLEAASGEQSWINSNATGKGRVGILLNPKYEKLVTDHGSLYDDRVVWIKMEGVEGGKIGIACVYASNIHTERKYLWYIMMESLLNDCDWIIGRNYNMTERPHDKSNDCGHAISEIEKSTWNGLLNAFQVQDSFQHEGGPRFSWSNGPNSRARRLASLDRFNTPNQSRLGFYHKTYYIHGYIVGSDHSPIQLEISIGGQAW